MGTGGRDHVVVVLHHLPFFCHLRVYVQNRGCYKLQVNYKQIPVYSSLVELPYVQAHTYRHNISLQPCPLKKRGLVT